MSETTKRFVVCIAGGGSRYTPGILKMLVNERDRFPLSKVILFDSEPERQERIAAYGRILMGECYPECEIVDTCDPETAFTGIDFCFMQIRVGRLKMRRSDEHVALAHGCIGQETCGAGGFAYGMRSIPAVVEIIRDVKRYSPDAWLLAVWGRHDPSFVWAGAEAFARDVPEPRIVPVESGHFALENCCKEIAEEIIDFFCVDVREAP